jgi:flagellar hook-length control protein FliK
MAQGRLRHLDVAPPYQRLRFTVMQLAKPVSPSLPQAAVLVSPAAGNPAPSTPTTTPFAAMLESHHEGQQPNSVTHNVRQPNEDRSSAQNTQPADKPQDPNRAASNDRSTERQLERNRLNAQREARQITNRPASVPPNKDVPQGPNRVGAHSMQETAAQDEAASANDADADNKSPVEAEFNPLSLLQWISDQAAQPALAPEGGAVPADSQDVTGSSTDEGSEPSANAAVLSTWHTIKTAAGNPAAGTPDSMGDKTPSARSGLNGKVPLASGLLAPTARAQATQEQPNTDNPINSSALGASGALTAGAIGLEGWNRAAPSAASDVTSTMPAALQKAATSAAAVEVSTNPQPFALNPGNSGVADSAAVSVNLPAPVQSPEFRELLGTQVSLLARDGVQSAELHLNPAEMGPVSVQITLDGTQARVDFGADSAQTRHIIEAGLPELASALRDAGLTLSGGGVSQHAGGRGDQAETSRLSKSGSRRSDDNVVDAVQRPSVSTRRVALGGVDLYA